MGGNTVKRSRVGVPVRIVLVLACIAVALCIVVPTSSMAEGELEKISTDDKVLDRNGDGTQDVIVNRKKVHYDVDFDGKFDYYMTLNLSEYKTGWHKDYIASGRDPKVFDQITMDCLDELCASSREEARWYENNFRDFTYYSGWYNRLYLYTDNPANDGRLTQKKHKGKYDFVVGFNPDGTISYVKNGDKKVSMAKFDEASKISSGEKMTLPKIESKEDLEKVRTQLAALLK